MKLERYDGNPILEPVAGSSWEDLCACNPAAWYDGEKVYLLYRGAPEGDEHPIYFGLATSRNGRDFERDGSDPVFGPCEGTFEGGCVEDPRIVRFGDTYFVTYATRAYLPGAYYRGTIPLNHFNPDFPAQAPLAIRENLTRSALAATKDFRTWHRFGPITPATEDDRDVILFPEQVDGLFVMLHRPAGWLGEGYGCEKPSIWMPYEKEGLVPNVVFPCGNVVIDGVLHVYYGGADRCCALATVPLDALVDHLLD